MNFNVFDVSAEPIDRFKEIDKQACKIKMDKKN